MENLKILIVDDEAGMRLGVERALRNYTFNLVDLGNMEIGFEVIQAESGEKGLELIDSDRPDILLLDHKLPGISGLQVLEKISGRENCPLTVMITAYASIETAVKATREGAYDFLPKPFTPQELRYSVQKAAGRVVLARQARQLTEEKKKVRFNFIRVLGHELKAPLGAVESNIAIMESKTLGNDLDKYGQLISRSLIRLEQMRKLIVDLLDMTRLESGEKVRELSEIDLREVARSCIELLESNAAERNIGIELHSPDKVPLMGDRGELDMIFNNLVSNAVKYNRDGGRVDIRIEQGEGEIVIAVSDTGIGMSETEVNKLFGEFVRIRNTKTRNILGSGLGLSILKRLAELYGGDVSVESQEDVGTTFRVRLQTAPGAIPEREVENGLRQNA